MALNDLAHTYKYLVETFLLMQKLPQTLRPLARNAERSQLLCQRPTAAIDLSHQPQLLAQN